MPDRDLRAARYVAKLCVQCGERDHSAGRTRCNECHGAYSRGEITETEVKT